MEEILFTGASRATIHKVKVRMNETVRKGQVLVLFRPQQEEKLDAAPYVGDGKLKAAETGTIMEVLVKDLSVVEEGAIMFRMKKGCAHAVTMKDMCAECGADLRMRCDSAVRQSPVSAAVPMVPSIPELLVSSGKATQLGQADIDRLLKSRRLPLLVDLDQTLIHTTTENVSNNVKDIHHFSLTGANRPPWYHTKLRPGTAEFLNGIKEKYELYICTFGTRQYAHQIAKILDKDGALFSHRILSRDELLDPFYKTANMKSLFPVGDQMVCIIDDREDVWNFSPSLIHVRPYHYFKNTGDINAPFPKNVPKIDPVPDSATPSAPGAAEEPAKRLSEAVKHQYESQFGDEGQEDSDDYLLYLKNILLTVHTAYYQLYDELAVDTKEDLTTTTEKPALPDMKNIVPYVRKKVLKGCGIVFTGLFPQDIYSEEKERAWALAKSFGATVTDDIVEKKEDCETFTTHLIAAKDGTLKVTQARKMGHVNIIGPEWLKECIRRWEKVEERLFPLQEGVRGSEVFLRDAGYRRPGPPEAVRKRNSGSVSCISGLSLDELSKMDHEVDDEMADANLTDSDSESLPEDDEAKEEGEEVSRKRPRKTETDSEPDNEDDDETDAKYMKSDELRLSSSTSSSDGRDELSDNDDDTLGEMAAELDRRLGE